MVSLFSPVWPRICGDPPASACLHVWLLYVFKVDLSMYQKSILFKGWIIFCSWMHVFPSNFYFIIIMYVCIWLWGGYVHVCCAWSPCACWGQNVISQELLPSCYLLGSGTCLANTFTPSLGTVCFLFVVHSFFGHKLLPLFSSVDSAGSCLSLSGLCFCPVSRCGGVAVSFRNTRGPARESGRLCLPALLIFRTEQQ